MVSAVPAAVMTLDEFVEWSSRPENADRLFELDRGRVVEVPPPKSLHGTICAWVAYLLWSYVIRRGRGRVVGNDAGLIVERDPDTLRGVDAMLFDESTPVDLIHGYDTARPVLVVEVRPPSDRPNRMHRRVGQYLSRGVPIVWVVDPEDQTVAVHRPGGQPPTP